MRAWIKDNANMVRQINIDAAHLDPPQAAITSREQAMHLVKNIDTRSDSTDDNTIAKVTDALHGPQITKRDFATHCKSLIRHADRKFPDTNFLPTSFSELTGDLRGRANAFMISHYVGSRIRGAGMGAGDAAPVIEGTGSGANCWVCGKNGHIKANCPERARAPDKYVDRGTSKKLKGVDRNVKFRHDPDSKHNPGEQDKKKEKEKRVFGPTKYIKGVHTQCEHVINGKVYNGHHLRRDCVDFKELQRVARETAAVATEEEDGDTVGGMVACVFDVTCVGGMVACV
jgi:hypothetical protein